MNGSDSGGRKKVQVTFRLCDSVRFIVLSSEHTVRARMPCLRLIHNSPEVLGRWQPEQSFFLALVGHLFAHRTITACGHRGNSYCHSIVKTLLFHLEATKKVIELSMFTQHETFHVDYTCFFHSRKVNSSDKFTSIIIMTRSVSAKLYDYFTL